jgi:hypothetical protein
MMTRASRGKTMQRILELEAWQRLVALQLALFPDDRAISALAGAELDWTVCGEALVLLGSRPAMLALVEKLRSWEDDLAEMEKLREVTEKSELTKEAADAIASYLARLKAEVDSALSRIAAVLAERGFTAPEARTDIHAHWKNWCENLERFPEHLPGVTSPAW